jgi:MFS family permease
MIYLGLTTVMAGHMLLILNLGFILAAPLAGWASDRLGSRKWLITFSLAAMALIVWGLSGLTRPAGMILVALLWIGLGVATSPGQLMYAHAKERMPAHMSGTAMTAINFFVFLGAAVFVHGLGEILGRTQGGLANGEGYQRAFFFCSVALALAAFLYALTKDTRAPQAGEPGPSAAVKS